MRFVAATIISIACLAPLTAAAASPTPVLVELFTSEGCSSCPPADAVLRHLSDKQPLAGIQVIALSEHVDYWDNYGWVDRFSAHQFTRRQQRYAQAFGRRNVYTPQMVVSGQRQFVGSNRARAFNAIRSEADASHLPIELTLNHTGAAGPAVADIHIRHLPSDSAGADLWLAVTEDDLHTDVRGGENGGARLKHTAVVRRLNHIASLHRQPGGDFSRRVKVPIASKWQGHRLHVVVFAQAAGHRRVLGAATRVLQSG